MILLRFVFRKITATFTKVFEPIFKWIHLFSRILLFRRTQLQEIKRIDFNWIIVELNSFLRKS